MANDTSASLRQVVNLIDELRDIGLHKYINLPRICVAGTQSSGKSSVLESIVGIDFLPRGDGIVTRRPIEFRLCKLTDEDESGNIKPYIIFDGNGERYYDFEAARQHIESLTNEIAGANKGIVDDPIVLSVYSPDCPDLSLIDLPGVTRVPLKNSDQTDDIEALTKDMIMRYAKDPRTIILAVVAANVDMSTSDALQLARRADPLGVRTLGVITKIDLMDRGANAVAMLQNDEVPLRLGYTGVKNRSAKDIADGVTIKEALELERKYFSEHKVYKHLKPTLWGIPSLVDKLTKVLYRHISTVLPDLKAEISSRIKCTVSKLEALGESAPTGTTERVQLLWQMTTDYCEVFGGIIKGRYVSSLHDFVDKDAVTGMQIRTIYNELLEPYTTQKVFDQMTDVEIDQVIQMHEGDSLPGFPNPDTFEYLILPQLQKLVPPAIECLERVQQTLDLLAMKVSQRVFARFPLLCEKVLNLSQNIFQEETQNARDVLEKYVECETMYIFTNDAQYMMDNAEEKLEPQKAGYVMEKAAHITEATGKAMNRVWEAAQGKKRRYSSQFIQEIRRRLNVYFAIVLRNMRDSVPKIIGHFLVRKVQKNMQYKIYTALTQQTQEELVITFGEPPHIANDRQLLKEQLDVLNRAMNLLQRDFNAVQRDVELFDATFDKDLRNFNIKPTQQKQQQPGSPGATPEDMQRKHVTHQVPQNDMMSQPTMQMQNHKPQQQRSKEATQKTVYPHPLFP
ncbi:Dynamin central region family protein [Babesia bovis T2Bo]|uniref:Dynamin-like protein n=1 Tax=Babesia bovis TaxID=5865 RepID=A7ATJ2_BABBO|nr:Dynamin central region family protein [Babesia bovis T2Bo]EDO06253.1 Dynamin central region family protein [Babesia bovis T2Bo]|eukprot:XP_001609821.1 dynamin-like protein [Babesia bovis T2Bo]